MANIALGRMIRSKTQSASVAQEAKVCVYPGNARRKWLLLAVFILLSPLAFAQNPPQVTSVDPTSGKVDDTATVAGKDLGKDSVSAVFLSDDKNDYKATIVEQSDEKITLKIPQVKSGDYNISIQVGDKIFIKPVKFKVGE